MTACQFLKRIIAKKAVKVRRSITAGPAMIPEARA